MKINRSNSTNNFVEVSTQNEIERARPTTTTGIANHRDSFVVTQQKENPLFSNTFGGPMIGTLIGEAIGNPVNDKQNGAEQAAAPLTTTQMKANNANDQAIEAAEKQRELVQKEKKERVSEPMDFPVQRLPGESINDAIMLLPAAMLITVGNIIGEANEDKEASKEKESSNTTLRRKDDD